jgi:hypothetical protein
MWFEGQFAADEQVRGLVMVPPILRGKWTLKNPTSPGLVPAILISRRTKPGEADLIPRMKSLICAKPIE